MWLFQEKIAQVKLEVSAVDPIRLMQFNENTELIGHKPLKMRKKLQENHFCWSIE